MIEVGIHNIQKSFGAYTVLENIHCEIERNHRVGFIGKNGSGKTTLFKIIAGMDEPDAGQIVIRKNTTVGYLDQIPEYPSHFTVMDVLNTAFESLFSLRNEIEQLEQKLGFLTGPELEHAMRQYGKLQSEFEAKEGYNITVNLNKICTGLHIDEDFRSRCFESLSGGEKTSVILAKLLLLRPDILLLDEPTNHLDIDAVEWLEKFLSTYKGTVLIISHDRYFLDKIVTSIIEIEYGKAIYYAGNYSFYVKEKKRRFLQEFEQYKDIQKRIKAMKAAAERYRVWGRINSDNTAHFHRAKRLESQIEELEKYNRPTENRIMGLRFSAANRSGNDVLQVKHLSKSFGKAHLFSDITLHIGFQDAVALLGKNGTGKSTFMKIILSQLPPDKGVVDIGSRVKIGYLEQEIHFSHKHRTVLEEFRFHFAFSEEDARSKLANFLFFGDDVFKQLETLSGGEKVRLKLCILMQQEVNFLLLDEPSNHLDIDSRTVFEEALQQFHGTIFFISHDRYFINIIAKRIVELDKGSFHEYLGNYDYYRARKEEKETLIEQNKIEKYSKENANSVPDKQDFLQRRKIQNAQKKMRRQLDEVEESIEKLEVAVTEKDALMQHFSTDYEQMYAAFQEKKELEAQLECLYTEWEKLQQKLSGDEA